jgi:N-methylhydantoinase B/oxoprolinase/acetone carboxylase alpha subunit
MAIPTADEKLEMIRLAEPTEDELRAVATLAPGDYEIGFQRTNDILDEALEVFQRPSRSSMGVAGDVMIALFSANGDIVNAAAGTYLHAIIQPILIKYILEQYDENPGVSDGDIWFANDALYGGIHNPDQVIVIPIFHEGKLIAWAGAANHTTETGAVEPGGMPVSATTRFHEGLNLPPVKIGENHHLRQDMLEVFNAFGIRAPQMITTDLKARATAADRVLTRILEVAEHEGADFVVGVLRRMLQVAEEGARKRIALKAGDDIDLDFRKIVEERSIGGQWEVEFMGRSIRPYDEGDVMAFGFSAGGAGYGDPLEADPEDVARDFAAGLISAWTVREIYKVAYGLPDAGRRQGLVDPVRRSRLEGRRGAQGVRCEPADRGRALPRALPRHARRGRHDVRRPSGAGVYERERDVLRRPRDRAAARQRVHPEDVPREDRPRDP